MDVTLHVHTHTPLYEYAVTPDYEYRRETGCLAFSPGNLRSEGEPWMTVSNTIDQCAIMDLIPLGNQEYSI